MHQHAKKKAESQTLPSQSAYSEVEEFTDDFLKDIRYIFEHYLKAFNEIKQEESQTGSSNKEYFKNSIFIYNLSETKGFMLFKKDFKLIFSYVKPGRIRIKFLKERVFSEKEVLIDAYLQMVHNDMMSVNWVHEGKKGFVDKNILVRHYMKHFIQEN